MIPESFTHYSPLLERDIGPYLRQCWKSIEETNFTGYDPGSFMVPQYERFFLQTAPSIARLWNSAFYRMVQIAGYPAIRLLRLPKITSTKAVALCASGFAALARAFPNKQFFDIGMTLLERLERSKHPGTLVWSPDFIYRVGGKKISQDQPCFINSLFAAEAYWDWFSITDDDVWKKSFCLIGRRLLDLIPRIETADKCCFTYNPAGEYYVHNANMLMAALLARVSKLSGGDIALDKLVNKCLNYTLSDIDLTKSVPYAGPPTPRRSVDNYHTGYVLRALQTIRAFPPAHADIERIERMLFFLLEFYLKNFIDAKGVYQFAPQYHIFSKRLVQAHSFAEALLIHGQFHRLAPDRFGTVFAQGMQSAFRLLWDSRRGYFLNEVLVFASGVKRRNVTPMPRWAWSWIFYGLARIASYESAI